MEKKRKKNSGKEAVTQERRRQETPSGKGSDFRQDRQQKAVQPKPTPKASPALTEKDRMILQDVEHIIWNPDLLKKLKGNNAQPPNGYSKKKASLK